MASTNDITGDSIVSKKQSDSYRENFDRIFKKDKNGTTEKESKRSEMEQRNSESRDKDR